jgi:hypothetical protein
LVTHTAKIVRTVSEEYVRRRFYLFGREITVPRRCRTIEHHCEGFAWAPGHIVDLVKKVEEDGARIRFILSYWDVTWAAIIYVAPDGIPLPEWIRQQLAKERASFR